MSPWTDRVGRIVVGVWLTAGAAGMAGAESPMPSCDADSRCQALRNFFLRNKSPLVPMAGEFIRTADSNGLDWRLLPAISMVETTAGRFGAPGNVFGWNSGRTRFPSVEAGIHYVASRLAHSPIYAGLTARGILQKYNPARKTYPARVLKFMQQLSAEPVR